MNATFTRRIRFCEKILVDAGFSQAIIDQAKGMSLKNTDTLFCGLVDKVRTFSLPMSELEERSLLFIVPNLECERLKTDLSDSSAEIVMCHEEIETLRHAL